MSNSKKNNLPAEEDANNTGEIVDPEIEEIVSNVVNIKGGGRKAKFHLYRMFNLPIKTCAILAGYNEDYGYKLVAEYKQESKIKDTIQQIINDMPEAYKSVCKMRLVQVAEIEAEALREYQDRPMLAIDKPQLLKQIKQGSGVLSDDDARPLNVINIGQIQAYFRANHEKCLQSQVIDIKPESKLIEE